MSQAVFTDLWAGAVSRSNKLKVQCFGRQKVKKGRSECESAHADGLCLPASLAGHTREKQRKGIWELTNLLMATEEDEFRGFCSFLLTCLTGGVDEL